MKIGFERFGRVVTGARLATVVLALVLVGQGMPAAGKKGRKAQEEAQEKVEALAGRPVSVDELKVVTCLLPGQVRKIGRQVYQTARRPVRTTVQDCEIRGGEYVVFDRANYRQSLEIWLEEANKGNADAQYYVAELYAMGPGTTPDYAQAAEWYRQAADNGNEAARFKLAHLYANGLGVEQDVLAAFELTGVRLLTAEEYDELSTALAERRQRVAELERQAAELRDERRNLEKRLESASAQNVEREAEWRVRLDELSQELLAKDDEIGRQKEQLDRLSEARETFDVAGPSIRILDTTTVRSTLPEDARRPTELVGVVEAPAGLDSLTVNDAPMPVDEEGFFRVDVGDTTTFEIVAIDERGDRALLLHKLGQPDVPDDDDDDDLSIAKKVLRGNYRALVIGNSDYETYPDLNTARADSQAIADVLQTRYGFETTLLQDATWLEISAALAKVQRDLKPQDSFLLYYAGHGEYDEDAERGYWLGVDAGEDGTNRLSSEDINRFLEALPAKHVLVIADSCYAGWLTGTGMPRFEGKSKKQQRDWFREVGVERVSRTGLSSGGLRPVLDSGGGGRHSIFAEELIAALDKNAERADVLATQELFDEVGPRVVYRTDKLNRRQRPEYKPISGHGQGEFFFVPVGGA